jgi:transposase-like protein
MAGKPNPPKEYATETTGRPSKFTPERRAAIIDAISHRIPYEFAAEANGICEDTLYEWVKIGKAHRKEGIISDYSKFSEDLKRAEMEKIRGHCDMIAAKPERWQADAWLLERRWYKHFGANAQVNELNQKLDRLLNGDTHEDGKERSKQDGQEV